MTDEKIERFERAVRAETVNECILVALSDDRIPPNLSAKEENFAASIVLRIVSALKEIERKYQ